MVVFCISNSHDYFIFATKECNMQVHKLTFNDFRVNTYILTDQTRECLIVDAACHLPEEEQQLTRFIEEQNLMPVKMVNTHNHIDHILGNLFVRDTYNIPLLAHKAGDGFLKTAESSASVLGFQLKGTVNPDRYVLEGDVITFGDTTLEVLYTPGHADGSICLLQKESGVVVSGDVLFRDSIGRTDLPTGDFQLLNENIKKKLFSLPDETVVYPGHGPETTIGEEIMNNPFVNF